MEQHEMLNEKEPAACPCCPKCGAAKIPESITGFAVYDCGSAFWKDTHTQVARENTTPACRIAALSAEVERLRQERDQLGAAQLHLRWFCQNMKWATFMRVRGCWDHQILEVADLIGEREQAELWIKKNPREKPHA